MSDFDKLGKQISEVDATMDAWIAKLGLGYNHFAVLYSLVAAEKLADKTFAKLGEKKTAQLFALLAEFCTVCREQIDKTDTVV